MRQILVDFYGAQLCLRVLGLLHCLRAEVLDVGVAHICERGFFIGVELFLHLGDEVADDVAFVLRKLQGVGEVAVALDELRGGEAQRQALAADLGFDKMSNAVDGGVHRAAAEVQTLRQQLVFCHRDGAAQQLAHALAGVGGDGDDGHGQGFLHGFDINAAAAAGQLVHHVEGNDHGDIQLDELQRKVEAALDIGRVNDVDDGVRLVV